MISMFPAAASAAIFLLHPKNLPAAAFAGWFPDIAKLRKALEYLLPQVIDTMVQEKRASVRVLETLDKWFGVTYKEDKDAVVSALRKLVDAGVYPEKL